MVKPAPQLQVPLTLEPMPIPSSNKGPVLIRHLRCLQSLMGPWVKIQAIIITHNKPERLHTKATIPRVKSRAIIQRIRSVGHTSIQIYLGIMAMKVADILQSLVQKSQKC